MSRPELLRQELSKRILILDGGMGTMLQRQNLTAADFGGEAYEGCNEQLAVTKPSAIASVHEQYLKAGADIVETCTFGSTPMVMDEYGLGSQAYEITRAATRIARGLADAYSTGDKPRFVAGSIGPTTKSLSLTGGATFQELVDGFALQAEALMEGGADYLLLETLIDTLNCKAGVVGIRQAFRKLGRELPIAVSGTIELQGVMLAGQTAEALFASLEHAAPIYVGLNCATGPEFMTDHIRTLAGSAGTAVACVPNAGLPNEFGGYDETPEMLARQLGKFADAGWLNVAGGCCGTTPDHIAAIADAMKGRAPRGTERPRKSWVTGVDLLEMTPEGRPYIVGERTNSIGSKLFRDLVAQEKWDEAAEIARRQARAGAHILDACLANPDRDELADMEKFLSKASKATKLPWMIDSQEPKVVEAAFRLLQGKCILNSVNLEEGPEDKRFTGLMNCVKEYGAMVVVGCIDEVGMAVEPQRKLEVAERSYQILSEKWGIAEEDIMFDALVFPCGTGDQAYVGSAAKTIEGVRLISERFPKAQSTLGVSNVSFGLPPAGREVLNSVFLYHCTKAGLTSAIVNAEKLVRYAEIPQEERDLCDDLIWNRGTDPVAAFTAYFRGKKASAATETDKVLPPAEHISRCILRGSKDGLNQAIDTLIAEGRKPLDVINGPLMDGMNEVGRLFNKNELIVAEVLQSAEAMKSAVAHLEPLMEKGDGQNRGKMVLATVKGDVHDIGKNLVEIILGNNGYEIVNLGIKCPTEQILAAVREHKPDLIGLSGLLVKSAQQMVLTARDLKEAGVDVPIMVGGAALSNNFTVKSIAPEYAGPVVYAKDAMGGLDLANQLTDSDKRGPFLESLREMEEIVRSGAAAPVADAPEAEPKEKLVLSRDNELFAPPALDRQTWSRPLPEVWRFLNPQMLYGKHLGLKGSVERLFADKDPKAVELKTFVEGLQASILSEGWMKVKGAYRFFPVRVEGDRICIYSQDRSKQVASFRFPRQTAGWGLSLSDFVHPTEWDHVALFVVTAGAGVRERSEALKEKGDYLASHGLQALALETAEAAAEALHKHIRLTWGFPDAADLSISDIFKAKYRGVRVSFGYPACPRLEDQEILFDLLEPQDLGVNLTEGFMMDPEASVSALVFHHPQGRYFTISAADLEAFERSLA